MNLICHNALNHTYFFIWWEKHIHRCGSGDIVHKYIIHLFLLVCQEFLNRFYNSLIARGVNFSLDTIEKELISFCLDVKGKENRLVW